MLYEVVIITKNPLLRNKAIDILALPNDRNGVNTGQIPDKIDIWELNFLDMRKYTKLPAEKC